MNKLTNPHDRFFKQVLSRPEVASDLLRYYLPDDIVAQLDLSEPPAVVKDSFVDQDLETHFSDLLYHVTLINGDTAYVYTLFDHKSYVDPDVALQLLRYQLRIWEQLPRQRDDRLTPVIPIVFYHGMTKWSAPQEFIALYPETIDTGFLPFLPNYRFHLIDLSQYSDEELRGEISLRITLLLFKYVLRPDLREKLPDIFSFIGRLTEQETGLEYLETILRYLSYGARHLSIEELRKTVADVLQEDETLATIAETLYQEGKIEGKIEGLHDSIGIILELKFGIEGLSLLSEIKEIDDVNLLQFIQNSMRTVMTLNEVRALYQHHLP